MKTDPPPDDLEVYPPLPALEAFEDTYETDAHCAMYELIGPEGVEDALPLLTKKGKSGHHWLKAQGLDIRMRWVILDVDTPGHQPVTPAWWVGQLAAINASPEARTAGWYRTRAGYHLVWALEPALSPKDWERFVAALRARLRRDGVQINDECKDWTRVMRMPRATRHPDEGGLQDHPMRLDSIGTLNLLAAPGLVIAPPPGDKKQEKAAPAKTNPWSLVDFPATHPLRRKLAAGQALSNVPDRRLPGERGRDTEILSIAGALAKAMPSPDAETIVQLMLPSVLASRRDQPQQIGDEDTLRDRVTKIVFSDREARGLVDVGQDADPFEDVPGIGGGPDIAGQPLLLGAKTSKIYYVLDDRTGGYEGPYSSDHTAKAVLELCPSRGARAVGDRGAPKEGTRIFHEDGGFISQIILEAGASQSRFDPDTGTLYEACAKWADVEPERCKEIEKWLQILAGDQLEKVLDWLATIRRIDRPTCAIYLRGAPGTGKSMLAEGLSLLWASQAIVPYDTLSSNFDGMVAESLLIAADEKMHGEGPGRGSPSAVFRTATTASKRSVKRKHLPDAVMRACFRLVVSSNDDDALNLKEQLNHDGLAAIAERILYVSCDDRAGDYLRELGGREHTEAWVAGGALARHVRWLEETREVVPGPRLLVEGDAGALMGRLRTGTGINKHVMAALARYLAAYGVQREPTAIERITGSGPTWHPRIVLDPPTSLLVNLDALFDRWESLHGRDHKITRGALATSLRALSRETKVRKRIDDLPIWLYQVPLAEILIVAEDMGIGDSETLRNICYPPKF